MSIKTFRTTKYMAGAAFLASLLGCGLGSELFNPDFFSSLGIDSQTIVRSPGKIVLAFRNSTNGVILNITTQYTDDRALIAQIAGLPVDELSVAYATEIAANETRTLVLDCPVAIVAPGTVTAVQAVVADAAVNVTTATLTYEGAPLVVDRDFECGDVIEMELIQTGDATDSLALRVRVLPGR